VQNHSIKEENESVSSNSTNNQIVINKKGEATQATTNAQATKVNSPISERSLED
jgi:hypothetical protein